MPTRATTARPAARTARLRRRRRRALRSGARRAGLPASRTPGGTGAGGSASATAEWDRAAYGRSAEVAYDWSGKPWYGEWGGVVREERHVRSGPRDRVMEEVMPDLRRECDGTYRFLPARLRG